MHWSEICVKSRSGNNPPPAFRLSKSDAEWQKVLSPEVFRITRRHGTEAPYSGAYCERFEPGSYACCNCGVLLFDAHSQFASGSGWPSFTEPVDAAAVAYFPDESAGMERVEVRCNTCEAHLGHVFNDGPGEEGLRYCINSAALLKLPSGKPEKFNLVVSNNPTTAPTAPFRLLYVFRIDCPGCFLYGFEEAGAVARHFSPEKLQVIGLCSAFDTFANDLEEQLNGFLTSGKLHPVVEEAFVKAGMEYRHNDIPFPVLLDRITGPEEFLNGDTLQWFYSLNPNHPLLSPEEIRNINQQANFFYRQLHKVAHTFSLNFMRGTPTFVLLNERDEKLGEWLGHQEPEVFQHTLRILMRDFAYL